MTTESLVGESSRGGSGTETENTNDDRKTTEAMEVSCEGDTKDVCEPEKPPTEMPSNNETCECQRDDEGSGSPAESQPAALPKKDAWGLSSAWTCATTRARVVDKKGETQTKPAPSFAEILNDQSRERATARLAYTNNAVDASLSLTEIQAEQERLFASFASKNTQKPLPDGGNTEGNESSNISMQPGIDEEERKMIELAIKQSLEESSKIHGSEREGTYTSTETKVEVGSEKVTRAANAKTDEETDREMIERAMREADAKDQQNIDTNSLDMKPAAAAAATESDLEKIEKEMIETAIREADAKERADAEAESLRLVMQLQQEEVSMARQYQQHRQRFAMPAGNVRTMSRAALAAEQYGDNTPGPQIDYDSYESELETGFRMNQQKQHKLSGWYRRDRNTIVGPDNEIRTKHDVKVQGQTNASFLDLDVIDDDTGLRTHVGNTAYNAFRKTMAGSYHAKGGHRGTSKGVATHGTGRAGSDADATKGGALDQQVRLHMSKAINAGIIEQCNGEVKQGKEAVVYHAVGRSRGNQTVPNDASNISDCTEGNESTISVNDGFDVAIKVFKRIKEFRGRGEYVDGDPRYAGRPFRSLTDREQLHLWTEKEYRNMVRAYRAEVPVPNPIHYKDNMIFMRFLGEDGWPAPQIREINIRNGSSKWAALYEQVMGSVKRLFQDARLVHGDLSEYNILIAPNFQVDYKSKNVGSEDDLQTVLIDFGQAVEVRHPKAEDLLKRDLTRVKEFFTKQGLATTMVLDDAMQFVLGDYCFSVNTIDSKVSVV